MCQPLEELETKAKINRYGKIIDILHLGENMGDLRKTKIKKEDYTKYIERN